MTEIPEHLRKRAEEARKKAAAAKAGGGDTPAAWREQRSPCVRIVAARHQDLAAYRGDTPDRPVEEGELGTTTHEAERRLVAAEATRATARENDADPDDIVKYELKPRRLLALTGLGLWILLVTGACGLSCVIVYYRYVVDYLESIPRKSSAGSVG